MSDIPPVPWYINIKTVCSDIMNIKSCGGVDAYAKAAPIKVIAWAFGNAPVFTTTSVEQFRVAWVEYHDGVREGEVGPTCLICHHAPFTLAVWKHQIKLDLPTLLGDTEVAARAVWPGHRSYAMASCAKNILGKSRMEVDPFEGRHHMQDLMAQAASDVELIRSIHLAAVAATAPKA